MTRLDCFRIEHIRSRLHQRSIVEVVQERRENWRVKVSEKPGSLIEQIMTEGVEGRRPWGKTSSEVESKLEYK